MVTDDRNSQEPPEVEEGIHRERAKWQQREAANEDRTRIEAEITEHESALYRLRAELVEVGSAPSHKIMAAFERNVLNVVRAYANTVDAARGATPTARAHWRKEAIAALRRCANQMERMDELLPEKRP